MRSFFKIFLASFLAFIVFSGICLLILLVIIGKALAPEKVVINPNAILVVETSQPYGEQRIANPLNTLLKGKSSDIPGLYDVVRLIAYAAKDDNIKGIYLAGVICGGMNTHRLFIENSREHAVKILDDIAQKAS